MTLDNNRLHEINLHVDNDAALIFQHRLVKGGKPLTIRSGANQIIWGYSLLTQVYPTYGGEVQQILGARIETLSINGQTRDNHQLEQIYDWFRAYMTVASGFGYKENGRRSEVPIVFSYPTRKWQFDIQVLEAPDFKIGTGLVATPWQIKAHIVPTGYDQQHLLSKLATSPLTSVLIPSTGIPVGIGYLADNPFSDAAYGGLDLAASGKTIGSNFQRLIGAWSVGDFAHFAFDGSAPSAYNALNVESKDYWTSIYGTDFINKGSQSTDGTGAQASGDPGQAGQYGTSGTCSAVSVFQNKFANALAKLTGFDFGFICTWMLSEVGKVDQAQGSRHPGGDYNYLNIGQNDSGPTQDANGANFQTPEGAAQYTLNWINDKAAASIKDFLKTMPGKSAEETIKILQASPWASSHYPNMLSVYNSTVKPNLHMASTTTGGGSVPTPTTGSIRQKAIQYAKWALANKTGIHYSHKRPNSATPLALPFETDCSGSVCMFYLWSGANNVGATFTGDMLSRLTHISEQSASPGDLVVIGTAPGHHAVMLLNKNGNDWDCFSHGGPGYNDFCHISPLSYYINANGASAITYLRWPGNIDA